MDYSNVQVLSSQLIILEGHANFLVMRFNKSELVNDGEKKKILYV